MSFNKIKCSFPVKGESLAFRYRMIFFTMVLSFTVSLLVFLSVGGTMVRQWKYNLASNFEQKILLLLDTLAAEAAVCLQEQDVHSLEYLVRIPSEDEITYITITGFPLFSSVPFTPDYIWATNNASLMGSAGPGEIRLADGIPFSMQQSSLPVLDTSKPNAVPVFDSAGISRRNSSYVFFKPIIADAGSDAPAIIGNVRLDISIEPLLIIFDEGHMRVLVSVILGCIIIAVLVSAGTALFSSIIFSPIYSVVVSSLHTPEGGSYGISGGRINSLDEVLFCVSRDLEKAAFSIRELKAGREIQKMLIPLDTDTFGRKLTFGSHEDDNACFFGYYEGAEGVSGDYFDYIKLDSYHYAIIKCDVAGKGVPAALIMMEISALFVSYFKDWNLSSDGYNLAAIVSRINDLIESRGFRDRFVAFTLGIFDSCTGDVYFCNAGDNLVHVFDASDKRMKTVVLPEVFAAGVFPSFVIERRGGFKVVKYHLCPGDILFLCTDGLEESRPYFSWEELPRADKDRNVFRFQVEMLGIERVYAVLEAVFSRSGYNLVKQSNQMRKEVYEFKFSDCAGTVEEAVIALVSVEKIFRICKAGCSTSIEDNVIRVDRKIDAFLRLYFCGYSEYFNQALPDTGDSEYMYYGGLKEMPQYDDLAILCVKKK